MTIDLKAPLLIAGAGKMGGALLAGLLDRGLDPRMVVVQDPAPSAEMAAYLSRRGIARQDEITALSVPPAVILAAVKPQAMDEVFAPLAKLAGPDTVVLSIAAGRTIASFERHLAPDRAVVRAMPNTPASIGRGITACCANAAATATQRQLCTVLLSAVGDVVWLTDEQQMDAVTAVSGSGPAYVFFLAECLANAGRAAGLEPSIATQLACATVSGAGELLRQSKEDAATLRQNVTSPGGTTAAAMEILQGDQGRRGMGDLIDAAVQAALKRARELAG